MTLLPTQPPLLSPQVHAKLSPRTYLTAHLTQDPPLRPSSRAPTQTRPTTINTSSLTHAHGSAVIRTGDTAVVCGIRGEILPVENIDDYDGWRRYVGSEKEEPGMQGEDGNEGENKQRRRKQERRDREEIAHLNLLVPNIELATGCSPVHGMPTGPPSAVAQTLSQRLLSLLVSTSLISMEDLRICHRPDNTTTTTTPTTATSDATAPTKVEVKAFWTLYIDILFLSLDHGPHGALTAAWTAVLAALRDVRLPRAYFDADAGSNLCDPDRDAYRSLTLHSDLPTMASFGVFVTGRRGKEGGGGEGKGWWVLSDPDAFEEALCEEVVCVALRGGGRVVRVEKNGGGVLGVEEMRGVVERAREGRGEVLRGLGVAG